MGGGFHPWILHLDETYFYEPTLKSLGVEVDLREYGIPKYMCEIKKLNEIERVIPSFERALCFIGKGDYHYISYILLKRVKVPFCLVVIDNHLDMQVFIRECISCGSWMQNAVCLRNLEKIIHIGKKDLKMKVKERVYSIGFDISKLKMLIGELPVYISIDKDILHKSLVNTNWDQGNLFLEDLIKVLSYIPRDRIIGIDVCGEPAFNLFSFEFRRSEKINLAILEFFNE